MEGSVTLVVRLQWHIDQIANQQVSCPALLMSPPSPPKKGSHIAKFLTEETQGVLFMYASNNTRCECTYPLKKRKWVKSLTNYSEAKEFYPRFFWAFYFLFHVRMAHGDSVWNSCEIGDPAWKLDPAGINRSEWRMHTVIYSWKAPTSNCLRLRPVTANR